MRNHWFALFILLPFLQPGESPVEWKYTAVKTADKTYEIHLTATVSNPWKIYSQTTPEGGPVPTHIKFNKNPVITLNGKIKETGEMKTAHEEVFGVDVHYYKDKVDFVQTIKLRGNVKTNVSGTVEFMVCNDKECLPPTTVNFTVSLQ